MTFDLAYGRGRLPIELPAGFSVQRIEKKNCAALTAPEDDLARALLPSMPDLARSARSACIVICDVTRPVPNGVLLPPLIRTLLESGIPPRRIVVLVATGLHRPNLGEELREVVGSDWVLSTVRVENHYAARREDHVYLAPTSRGTPVGIDRRFVEADLRMVVGLVEPHFMAGYSGGRKLIAPGIACEQTIRTLHNTSFMEHPGATACNLEGNPLHEEQLEIVRRIGRVHAVNTLLDEHRRIVFVNFGEIVASHAAATEAARRFSEAPLSRRYPVVVTSAAGYPLDATFYQTIKAMVTAAEALEPGGRLLVASECGEGLGSAEFREALEVLRVLGPEKFLDDARTRPLARVDEWQAVKFARVLLQARISLFSGGLGAEDRGKCSVRGFDNWKAAMAHVLDGVPPQEIAVIPDGPYTVPVVRRT